jgi:hydroxypyruvate reductase
MMELRAVAESIFRKALKTCSVEHAFQTKISARSSEVLALAGDGEIDLTGVRRVLIVAMGKGAATMLRGLLAHSTVTEGREIAGVLIAPQQPEELREEIRYFAGGHPSPNAASMEAALAVLDLLHAAAQDELAEQTFCFFLISGGASAMMELPLDPTITLEEMIGFHRALVHSGASIAEINCVRKHFSAVKGGRLALAAGDLPSITFAVSDVPAGQLDVLASGPTLPDSSTIEDCQSVLERYGLLAQFPERVREFFTSAKLVESPKAGDFTAWVYPMLSSDDLAAAAQAEAERMGFTTVIDNSCDDWDYRDAADYLLQRVRGEQQKHDSVCVISAGEVTVRLAEKRGKTSGAGGRNQHFALYGALALTESETITILSAGSDGIDGNSPAAGAVVEHATVQGSEDAAANALAEFDSFPYLERAGAAITTGPTGNNLRDLRLLLAKK